MSYARIVAIIKSAMERSKMAQDEPGLARQMIALVHAQSGLISDLRKENARLKLSKRYGDR